MTRPDPTPNPLVAEARDIAKWFRGEPSVAVNVHDHRFETLLDRLADEVERLSALPHAAEAGDWRELLEVAKDLRLVLRLAGVKFGFDPSESATMDKANEIIARYGASAGQKMKEEG